MCRWMAECEYCPCHTRGRPHILVRRITSPYWRTFEAGILHSARRREIKINRIISKMTKKQTAHLRRIKETFYKAIDVKYRKGAREHGGFVGDNPNLIGEILEEILDLWVYAFTLKEKWEDEHTIRFRKYPPLRSLLKALGPLKGRKSK